MGTPVYPAAKKTYTDEVNKEDLADAAVINSIQDEVQAIQEELGTDPAGSLTDLKTRLAISIADDGAMKNGTSFPVSPSDGDFFYRTDEDLPYIYNGSTWKAFSGALNKGTSFPTGGDLYDGKLFYRTDQDTASIYNGTSWDALGQSLSNVVFCAGITRADNSTIVGLANNVQIGSSSTTDIQESFWAKGGGTTYLNFMDFKFKKISSIASVTVWVFAAIRGTSPGKLRVTIGTATAQEISVTSTSWGWVQIATDIDVSGLTDGTTYDVTVEAKNGGGASTDMLGVTSIIGIAS